jgi:glycerol uptake facilitator protein
MKFSAAREFKAELPGPRVLILFGCGVVAMVTLFPGTPAVPGEVGKGGYTNVCLAGGLAVVMGIYVSGTISGAHLNPAAATGRFPWSKVGHHPLGTPYAPLSMGLLVVAIGMSFGGMHGYAINPARDLGPRLFTVVAGFKNHGLIGSTVWIVP